MLSSRHVAASQSNMAWTGQSACCPSDDFTLVWAISMRRSDEVTRGQLELPDKVVRNLQAEAAVMSHMRHPK